MGVGSIFGLALAVDVICGPLMTAILANPEKSSKERWVDFGLIGAIQLAALVYAIHALYVVRPVAQVFEVDRFVVVSANEVLTDQLAQSPLHITALPNFSRLLLGTRDRLKSEDIFQSAQMSLAGSSPAMRPSWWVDYAKVKPLVASRARPIAELIQARPQQAKEIQRAIQAAGLPVDQLQFLPYTTSRNKDWVVLINDKQELVSHAPVDGFFEVQK